MMLYNNHMKVIRRLLLMITAGLIAYSAWWQWYGLWPANTSLNTLISHINLAGVHLSIDWLNQISLSNAIFFVALVVLVAAVTGFKSIAWPGLVLQILLVAFVTIGTNSNIDTLASIHAGNGPWITIGATILTLAIIIFPKHKIKDPK